MIYKINTFVIITIISILAYFINFIDIKIKNSEFIVEVTETNNVITKKIIEKNQKPSQLPDNTTLIKTGFSVKDLINSVAPNEIKIFTNCLIALLLLLLFYFIILISFDQFNILISDLFNFELDDIFEKKIFRIVVLAILSIPLYIAISSSAKIHHKIVENNNNINILTNKYDFLVKYYFLVYIIKGIYLFLITCLIFTDPLLID